jgi:hypothetical protein
MTTQQQIDLREKMETELLAVGDKLEKIATFPRWYSDEVSLSVFMHLINQRAELRKAMQLLALEPIEDPETETAN